MDTDRFQAFLDVLEPGRGATVLCADPIPGGYSRDTVRAVVQWADGTSEAFVLRGDPPEDMSVFRSDRDREWLLLQAIKDLDGGPDFDQSREDFVNIIAAAHATALDRLDPGIERPESWRAHPDDVIAIYDRIHDNHGEADPILAYTVR